MRTSRPLSPAARPGCPGLPLDLLIDGLGLNVFCSQRLSSRTASMYLFMRETSGLRMQRGGNAGKEVACKRAIDDPERRSCFDVAVAVALFHFLLLALASSITLHDTTVTVIIV